MSLHQPSKRQGAVQRVAGLAPAELAYWLARQPRKTPLCVIAADNDAAEAWALDWHSLTGSKPTLLLGEEQSPFALAALDVESTWSQSALRVQLLAGAPSVVVMSAAAAQATWPPQAAWASASATWRVGQDIDREQMALHLLMAGYGRVGAVVDEGTFAVRGSVVDVFVPLSAGPLRIELFGDEITSIKPIEAAAPPGPTAAADEASRARTEISELLVAPIRTVTFTEQTVARANAWLDAAREHATVPSRVIRERQREIASHNYFFGIEAMWPAFYGESEAESVLAALLGARATVVLTQAERIPKIWRDRFEQSSQARERAQASQGPQVSVASLLLPEATLQALIAQHDVVLHAPIKLANGGDVATGLRPSHALQQAMEAQREQQPDDLLKPLRQALRQRQERGEGVVLCASHHGAAMRLRDLLAGHHMAVRILQAQGSLTGDALPSAGRGGRSAGAANAKGLPVDIAVAPLSSSVDDAARGRWLIADHELFHGARKRRPTARAKRAERAKDALNTLHDLRPGDCVIHQDHGIGRYQGLVRLVLDGVDGDFVALSYEDDDKLYVPVYRLTTLHRYHGLQHNAKLDKLGSGRFDRAKRRVRDAVMTMAHAMLALEARRKSQAGFALPAPTPHYAEFVASFPFEETPDQARAIEETLTDLQQAVPMDRLICGDVGFGKTEVALRATMLAVQGKKQVAVLVPTTVLAEQHRETFEARLAPFGVACAALNRFTSERERAALLERANRGAVDVIVGTHRLLTHDLHFKDLGLLVIDEEQRFGVKHKERLKQLRAHVHVLTMSATPIPRTLHLATSGMRQLSVIATPPTNRTAIKTEVLRADDEVMAEAIRREMARGGQTYVVFNRVQGIAEVAERVRVLVPGALVLVAHGQMPGRTLEAVMEQFVHRRAHVLVCTAIIESGIDIPSVNTMVVLEAQQFGLSQLYQLRGRIGRGTDRAYAYLMLPQELSIGKDVAERMNLLRRFSTLGAGLQVATHDLEMRGAGDLLGSEQSGHIAAVGFELYTQLLHEAVAAARGGTAAAEVEPDIKVPVAAVFPEQYMREPIDRLTFYQRMANAADAAGIYDILGEVASLFGAPPPEAEALAELMLLRQRLQQLGASSLSAALDATQLKVGVSFVPTAKVDRYALVELCQREPARYRALPSGRLAMQLPLPPMQPADPDRDKAMPYVLGADLLQAIVAGLAPLSLLGEQR